MAQVANYPGAPLGSVYSTDLTSKAQMLLDEIGQTVSLQTRYSTFINHATFSYFRLSRKGAAARIIILDQ